MDGGGVRWAGVKNVNFGQAKSGKGGRVGGKTLGGGRGGGGWGGGGGLNPPL